MQRLKKALAAMMLLTGVVFLSGCFKSKDVKVTTYEPQEITENQAKCGGDVIVTQGLSLTEIGVCWSTERNPTYSDSHVSTSVWNEPFVCTIENLEPKTKYHVRAYAMRGLEMYYGSDKSFTTLESNGGGGDPGGGDEPAEEDEYVDLGLPSGRLWATCNVGAERSWELGDYYAWGEKAEKQMYNWMTYQFWNGSQVIKYTVDDGLVVLEAADDAASYAWGNGWRMPTIADWEELMANCQCSFMTMNDVKGLVVTGQNGKSIFLPAAGYYNNNNTSDVGFFGRYWSSSLYQDDTHNAWRVTFNSNGPSTSTGNRYMGQSIRPVRDL